MKQRFILGTDEALTALAGYVMQREGITKGACNATIESGEDYFQVTIDIEILERGVVSRPPVMTKKGEFVK